MDSVLFWLIKLPLHLLALLPLRALYFICDFTYYIVYYIIRYRRKVVKENIDNSFSDRPVEERNKIIKDFYRHFCDYIFETIKLLHISDDEMRKRMNFSNIELVQEISKDGKPIFMTIGHYCNWEWIPSIMLCDLPNLTLAQIYRPLRNKAADKFFLKLRSRFGSDSIAKNDTLREIIRYRKEGKQIMIGFIADQTPSPANIHYWTMFLNQMTPCLTGPEKIGKKIDANILFLDVKKIRRGYYEAVVKVISTNAKETKEFEITEMYMRLIEKEILRQPPFWLWTHKRWKHRNLYNGEQK